MQVVHEKHIFNINPNLWKNVYRRNAFYKNQRYILASIYMFKSGILVHCPLITINNMETFHQDFLTNSNLSGFLEKNVLHRK